MKPALLGKTFRESWARRIALLLAVAVMLLALPALAAIDQAMPTHDVEKTHAPMTHENMAPPADPSAGNRDAFAGKLDLSSFRLLAVQHNGQVKILDSWARQSLYAIARKRSLEGQDPVYTAFDMILRPDVWAQKNIIYVQAVPIRQLLSDLADSPKERDRIMHEGTVSPAFVSQDRVYDLMQRTLANDQRLAEAINKVYDSLGTFMTLEQGMAIVPPVSEDRPWVRMPDLIPNSAKHRAIATSNNPQGIPPDMTPVPGYDDATATKLLDEFGGIVIAWTTGDADKTNAQFAALSKSLPNVHPGTYPLPFKREVELWYNRSFNGTMIGVPLYAAAMVLFLLAVSGVSARCNKWGRNLYLVALLLNIAVMAVRWYLAGRIPIQNMFESVMGSALLGCILGWFMEHPELFGKIPLWMMRNIIGVRYLMEKLDLVPFFERQAAKRGSGFFGLAMCFVGFSFTTACMVVPLVFGKSMGENVGPAAGILMTYWLYIHVNVVIFSYALIAASFVIGAIFLIARLWYWISPTMEPSPAAAGAGAPGEFIQNTDRDRRSTLESLDAANVIIMRLAFFFLGTGIILGAVWADVSWGRPWGWDPKETFALVTWLVYLILIHVRFAAPATKGTATALLSVGGCAVMLFNWIGVNFFLVGLHSYA